MRSPRCSYDGASGCCDSRATSASRDAEASPFAVSAAASILVACFYILAGGVPYQELGADYFQRLNSPQRRAARHLNDLRDLGWQITQTDDGVICFPPKEAAA